MSRVLLVGDHLEIGRGLEASQALAGCEILAVLLIKRLA